MIIPFDFRTVFVPGSSPVENAEVLKVLLDSLIAIDVIHLNHHPETPLLMDPAFGVVYGRTDEWMPIPTLWINRFGDCKSLAAMRVAEMRKRGRPAKPVFRFRQNNRGGTDYHILVQVGANAFDDPSKECGMTDNEWAYFGNKR